jgi:hypothetical protein
MPMDKSRQLLERITNVSTAVDAGDADPALDELQSEFAGASDEILDGLLRLSTASLIGDSRSVEETDAENRKIREEYSNLRDIAKSDPSEFKRRISERLGV